MNVLCPHCGRNVEVEPGAACPECAKPLAAPGDATLVTRAAPPETVHSQEGPAPSVLASPEAELLQHGRIRPPTHLGSRGRIGRFEIVKPLGRGGMGYVFAATEPVTGTTVALKMLRDELAKDPRIVHAFLTEARHMYQLSHPSILKVLEVSGPDDGPFFVMPLVTGGSLDKRIHSEGVPAYNDTLAICTDVAEGLAHAHAKGLIHRDLKPANILLGEDGHAMITDFGLVRSFLGDSMLDVDSSSPEGTPMYMSPSVAAGQAEDTRCDIYSFGAMMYEMLAGRPPYQGRDAASVMQAVLAGPPEPLAAVNPKAPQGLVAVADWCMARELRDRYASMSDVLEDLRRLREGKAPLGPHGSGTTRIRTRVLALSAAAVLLLLLAGYTGWRLFNRPTGGGEGAGVSSQVSSVAEECARADGLRAEGKPDDAEPLYRAVLVRDPANVRALIGLGVIEEARRRYFEATELYRQARVADPAGAEASYAMVSLLIKVRHLGPARRELEEWLRADPDSSQAQLLMEDLETAEAQSGGESTSGHPPPFLEGRLPGPGGRHPPPREGGPPFGPEFPPAGRRPPGRPRTGGRGLSGDRPDTQQDEEANETR
jgi:tetratricopeptide (TPR) repeat protein